MAATSCWKSPYRVGSWTIIIIIISQFDPAQMKLIIDFAKKVLRQERGVGATGINPAQLVSQSAGGLIYEQQPSIGHL